MRQLKLYLIVLGALGAPGFLFSQNNRLTVQTGLFHCFFDGSPITSLSFKKQYPNYEYKRRLRTLFGGVLNDSKGIQIQRMINSKSSISAEFMVLNCAYDYKEVFNSTATPVVTGRNIQYANITYSRNILLNDKLKFVYGGGLNFVWGLETMYHYTFGGAWGEPRFYSYARNDFGLNARTGIDYSPLKWLTISTNLDFISILYLGATDGSENDIDAYYKLKFGLSNIPSRYDLSWRFGVGVNF